MKVIESPSHDAYFNMALEEFVFEELPKSDSYLMLWQNKNAVVVGKYQNTTEEIDRAFVQQHDIAVVRRLSGGGAMYQDMGNLNFTFIVDQNSSKSLDFNLFTAPVVEALAGLGVQAETGSRNDILIGGKKFSGNSQYNKKGRTMHHGTLLFCSDLDVLEKALRVPPEKTASKGVSSVRSRVTNIADHLPAKTELAAFKRALLAGISGAGNPLEPYCLTATQLANAERLRAEKYVTWSWNYGASPAFNLRRQRRYSFGGVSLLLAEQENQIHSLSVFGDFFGNGNMDELTAALEGCPLDAAELEKALRSIPVGEYIHGMDVPTMIDLIING